MRADLRKVLYVRIGLIFIFTRASALFYYPNMENKYAEWLKANRDQFNIKYIERALKMPDGSLAKFVKGERPLAETWHKPLEKHLRKLANKIYSISI